MANLKDIKRRIKSVQNTEQITKAMKMVSAAKLRRAEQEILAARPYADKMLEIISDLSSRTTPEKHRLLGKEAGTGKIELILFTSDRGLCGGFNAMLIRTAERFMRKRSDEQISLNILGRRASDYFKRRSQAITSFRTHEAKRDPYTIAAEIAHESIGHFLDEGEEGVDEVHIVYSRFKNVGTQIPVVQQLLPISTPDASDKGANEEASGVEPLYEPSEDELLEDILPKYIEVQVFRALLEGVASEHAARMTAMDSASRNALEMISALTLVYNRARQASITKELLEIIGGSEALKKD